jgi:hypothetical protein
MGADIGTIVFFSLIIFGVLEFALVIIPALISRAKVKSTSQPFFDVPVVLSRPVSPGQGARMRAWYFDETGSFRYDIKNDPATPNPANFLHRSGDYPCLPGPHAYTGQKPVKDWIAVNNANRAILRANKALLEANSALFEANAAMQQVTDEDWEWIDEIADIHRMQSSHRK